MGGLEFLNPLGLLALAALAVPLLIHLFRRSRGRRVPVGNIALYQNSRRLQLMEPRLQQWLLFLLRSLLVILAALWLAGLSRPHVEHLVGSTAYVSREWLTAPGRDPDMLGSHDQAFVLAEGFPAIGADPAETRDAGADLWSLLALRFAEARHEGEVHVYALAAARQFPAQAPGLGTDLIWHLDDRSAKSRDTALPALDVTLRYTPAREFDARLVATALDLLASKRKVDLRYSLETAPGGSTDPDSVRTDERRRVLLLLADGDSPVTDRFDTVLQDTVTPSGPPDTLRLDEAPESLFRVRPAPGSGGTVLWRTEGGAPLLVARATNDGQHLTLLDRLTPRDNGLLNSEVFPEVLLHLLLGETGWSAGTDTAPADPTHATARDSPVMRTPMQSLMPWLALAMALLLAIERWMSERPPPRATP